MHSIAQIFQTLCESCGLSRLNTVIGDFIDFFLNRSEKFRGESLESSTFETMSKLIHSESQAKGKFIFLLQVLSVTITSYSSDPVHRYKLRVIEDSRFYGRCYLTEASLGPFHKFVKQIVVLSLVLTTF